MASYGRVNQDDWHHHNGGDPRDMSIDEEEEDQFFKTFEHTNGSNSNNPLTSTPLVTTAAPEQSSSYVVHDVGAWQGIISIPRAVTTDEQSNASPASTQNQNESNNVSSDDPSSIAYQDSSLNSSTSERFHNNGFQSPTPTTNNSQQDGVSIHVPDTNNSKMSSLSLSGVGKYLTNATTSNNTTQNGADILDGTAYFSLAASDATPSPVTSSSETTPGGQNAASVFRRSTLEQHHSRQEPSDAKNNTNQFLLETSTAISMSPPSPMRSVGDIFQNTSLTPQRITVEEESECEKPQATTTHLESRLPPQVVSVDGSSWATTRERASCASSRLVMDHSTTVDASHGMPPKPAANNVTGSINNSRRSDTLYTIAQQFQQHQQQDHTSHRETSEHGGTSVSLLSVPEAFSKTISPSKGRQEHLNQPIEQAEGQGPPKEVGISVLSDIEASDWSKDQVYDDNDDAQPEIATVDDAHGNAKDRTKLSLASLEVSEVKESIQINSPVTPRNNMVQQRNSIYMARIEELEAEKAAVQVALTEQMQLCQELEAQIVNGAIASNKAEGSRTEDLETALEEAQRALAEEKEQYEAIMTAQMQLSQSEADEEQEFMLQLNAFSPLPESGKTGHLSYEEQQRKLMERNNTLVKEVRFADQTCVELSSKLQVRETELEQLRSAHERLSKEIIEANRTGAKVEVVLEQLNQANDDKRGLERQLHSAYDKIDAMSKEFQSKQETLVMRIEEQSEAAKSNSGTSDEIAEKDVALSALRRENQSLTTRCQQYDRAAELQQQQYDEVMLQNQDLITEIKALCSHNIEKQHALDEVTSEKHNIEQELRKLKAEKQQVDNVMSEKRDTEQELMKVKAEKEQTLDNAISEKRDIENELRKVLADTEDQQQLLHTISSERNNLRAKAEELQSRYDAAEQTLSETREVLTSVTDNYQASREEKKKLAVENASLKKELAESKTQLQEAKEQLAQSLGKPSMIAYAEASERGFERLQEEFTSCVEKNIAEVQASLTALTAQFDGLGGTGGGNEGKMVRLHSNIGEDAVPGGTVNPSLLSQLLSSSSNGNGAMLSPQVVQILQLILTFTDQNLHALETKVARETSQYADRLTKLYFLVNYIRSSLVFETDDSSEILSTKGGATAKEDCEDQVLNATLTAVSSVPDKNVDMMEGGIGLATSPQPQAERPSVNAVSALSPVRESIQDLSMIEAVNSPFYNSEITFSLDSSTGNKMAMKGSLPGGRQLFGGPLEAGRKELERLRTSLAGFKDDFSVERKKLSSFVEAQIQALQLLGEDHPPLLSKEAAGKVAGSASSVDSPEAVGINLHKMTLDLEASKEAEERLSEELRQAMIQLDASNQRIAALEKEKFDLEYRLIGERPARRMSFQERLDSFDSETVSGADDGSQQSSRLRKELLEARRGKEDCVREIDSLEKELMASKKAHDKLKHSYLSCNNRLAVALESLASNRKIDEELRVFHQEVSEAQQKRENDLVEEMECSVKKLTDEKETLENELFEKGKALQKALQDTKEFQALVGDATKYREQSTKELQDLQQALHVAETSLSNLKESRESAIKKSMESVAQLRTENDALSKGINDLQTALRLSEQAHGKLKDAYVTCNNKLAEALEQLESQESTSSEKKDADMRLRMAQEEVATLQSEIAEATKRKDAEMHGLKETLEQVKLSYVECNEQLATTEERATEMEQHLHLLQNREQQLRSDLSESNDALEKAKTERREFEGLVEQKESMIASLETRVQELEDELNEARLKAQSNSEAASSLLELEHERDEMRATMEDTRLQIEVIKTEMGDDLKRAQDQLTESLQTNNALRSELVAISNAKESCDDVLEKLKVSYLSVNNELANIMERQGSDDAVIEDLKAACDAAEELTRQTEDRLLDTRNALEETRREREDLANKIATVEIERDQLASACNNHKSEILDRDDCIATLKREVELASSKSDQELASVTSRLRGLRRDVLASLETLNIEVNENDHDESDFSGELQLWQDILPALREAVLGVLEEQGGSARLIQQLQAELLELRDAQDMLTAGFSDEKLLSDELGTQLREARSKLEFFAAKIEKLSNALELARDEASETRRKQLWSETARREEKEEMLDALTKEKGLVKEKEAVINDLESRVVQVERELSSLRATGMGSNEEAIRDLESQREVWETKCFKLRTYMRKLTNKCAEWETSYSQQSKALERLQAQQGKTRRTAAELARKYFQLTDDVQARVELHDEERKDLMNEISSFQTVHQQLEVELNDIAEELARVIWT